MDNKAQSEKMNLYNKAKEAYYNGSPIMEDFEFDALEAELGLENKAYVGAKHNASYTVKHPFIMGSLSKIQIHEKDGKINWYEYWTKLCKYIPDDNKAIITPKFDGCSFEINIHDNNIISISTRGDGEYGVDITKHIYQQAEDAIKNITLDGNIILRGEVLIDKNLFNSKYSEFVNPRSFVAGLLNRDYSNDDAFQNMIHDLSIVIYDVRIDNEGNWEDNDWTVFKKDLYTGFGYIDDKYLPEYFIEDEDVDGPVDFENIYNSFAEYRTKCKFALDGIVFKPIMSNRINNLTDARPKDCVAIKFVPMLEETEIINIEWSLGKTGELTPVIIVKPVIMDGKSITRASAHNWGYCIKNGINIGAKVILSLAGDIIPFIYKVTQPSDNLELLNTVNYNIDQLEIHDMHLMVVLSYEEQCHNKFIQSGLSLNITNLGEAELENIWHNIININQPDATDDFFNESNETKEVFIPSNILYLKSNDIYDAIVNSTKNGATGKAKKIKKAFEDTVRSITLKDIIKSCSFTACGDKVAEQIEKYILLGADAADFSHLAEKAYSWIYNNSSEEYDEVNNIVKALDKEINDFKQIAISKSNSASAQIPVILTGEPNDYASKAEFLKCHPEYRMTGSWKEVQIVFTNDLNSKTGKMKKAQEKNIEIRLY